MVRPLRSGALAAPHLVVLFQHEGLVHQRGVALDAAEAGVMPVAVFEMQLLQTGGGGGMDEWICLVPLLLGFSGALLSSAAPEFRLR